MRLYGNKKGKHEKRTEEELIEEQIAVEEQLEEKKPRKTKEPKKRKTVGKVIKIIIIVLLVIAALAAAAWFVFVEFYTEPPEISDPPEVNRTTGCYTFLVVGLDIVGNNTDTILVGTFDTDKDTIDVVSIPRDTLINSSSNVKKINSVYPGSINNGGDGYTALSEAVEKMLGFKVDNIVIIDLEAAAEIVDAIGGVYFDVPVDMYYKDPVQELRIDIPKGYQKLNGTQAVQVLRFRATYGMGDIDRISVQQDLFKALASQLLTLGNIPNIDEIIEIVDNRVTTVNTHTGEALTGDNVRFFLKEFLDLSSDSISFVKMPALNSYCGSICGLSYVFPDITSWIDMINERLNPYEDEITYEDLNMVTVMNNNFYYTTEPLRGGVTSFIYYNSNPTTQYYGMLPYSDLLTDEDGNS